jgi:hypothetical protein
VSKPNKKGLNGTPKFASGTTHFLRIALSLEEFPFADLSQCLSSKLYRFTNLLFGCLVNGFAFHGFPADSFRQQASLNANGISTVCNVAHFFGPFAPYSIATVESGILAAFESWARGRTSFYLIQ